ncbi:MAG: S1C family serine protease [Patescibacteria group bacterium]
MKAKIPPTSPKYKIQELENLYAQDNLKKIEKPPKRLFGLFSTLILAVVFGFLAGFWGKALYEYLAPKYPDYFPATNVNKTINPVSTTDKVKTNLKYQELRQNLTLETVNIFDKKITADEPLAGVYLASSMNGSGIIISSDGWILTTKAVVPDFAKEYVMVTKEKKIYPILDFKADPATDLVFIKVEAQNLKIADFSDAADIYPGENSFVIKNFFPGDQEDFLSVGLNNLSQKDFAGENDLINSSERLTGKISISQLLDDSYEGSPLFDENGKITGLASIKGKNDKNQFIPLANLKNIISSLLKEGEVIRPYLGVRYLDLSASLNLPDELRQDQDWGAMLYGREDQPAVVKGSPAEKAGLLANDIITKVNDRELKDGTDFSRIIQNFGVGETINLELIRKGAAKTVSVTLQKINS